MSPAPGVSLETTAVAQALIMAYVAAVFSTRNSLDWLTVPAFLASFWRRAVNIQSFSLANPAMVKADLEITLERPFEAQPKAIRRTVTSALGVRWPCEAGHVSAWLQA